MESHPLSVALPVIYIYSARMTGEAITSCPSIRPVHLFTHSNHQLPPRHADTSVASWFGIISDDSNHLRTTSKSLATAVCVPLSLLSHYHSTSPTPSATLPYPTPATMHCTHTHCTYTTLTTHNTRTAHVALCYFHASCMQCMHQSPSPPVHSHMYQTLSSTHKLPSSKSKRTMSTVDSS